MRQLLDPLKCRPTWLMVTKFQQEVSRKSFHKKCHKTCRGASSGLDLANQMCGQNKSINECSMPHQGTTEFPQLQAAFTQRHISSRYTYHMIFFIEYPSKSKICVADLKIDQHIYLYTASIQENFIFETCMFFTVYHLQSFATKDARFSEQFFRMRYSVALTFTLIPSAFRMRDARGQAGRLRNFTIKPYLVFFKLVLIMWA